MKLPQKITGVSDYAGVAEGGDLFAAKILRDDLGEDNFSCGGGIFVVECKISQRLWLLVVVDMNSFGIDR